MVTDRILSVPCAFAADGRAHDVGVTLDDGRVTFNKCSLPEADAGERLGATTCGRLLDDIAQRLGRGSFPNGETLYRDVVASSELFDPHEELRIDALRLTHKEVPKYRRPTWARRKVVRTLLAERLTFLLDQPVTVEPDKIRISGERTPSLYMLMPDTYERRRMSWVLANGPGDDRLARNELLRRYTLLLGRGGALSAG